MSIISRIARITIRAVLTGLSKEALKAERGVARAVGKRDKRIAALDKRIIELSQTEDAQIAKIREQADQEVRNIKATKSRLIVRKDDHRWNCGHECRQLNAKGKAALALKAKLEDVLK